MASDTTGTTRRPLVAVAGETASGKSGLALNLAERLRGEIICADSRTVYRGMDIGTAKPTAAEQTKVPHHLLDVVEPGQPFNAAEFKHLAEAAIDDIWARNRVPFLVGGTGLYIDAVIFDYAFRPGHDDERERLSSLSVEELQSLIQERGISMPGNNGNPRHLIRAIETNGAVAVKKGLRPDTLVIGLKVPGEILEQRIAARVDEMLATGMEKEVRDLAERYGWQNEALTAVGYAEWQPYLAGLANLDETRHAIITHTIQFAKRQRTWFKRNKNIQWAASADEADKIVARFLK